MIPRRPNTVGPRCEHPMKDGKWCGKPKGHSATQHVSEQAWVASLEHRHRRYLARKRARERDAATAAERRTR